MPNGHAYQEIDLANWKRARHYEVFANKEYPFVGTTTELDISEWDAARQQSNRKFFPAFLHAVTLAMNAVENFRYRIYENKVVLCETIKPSFVVFEKKEELYYFASLEMTNDPLEFDRRVEEAKQLALTKRCLESFSDTDVFYVSCTPWFGFTDCIQPMQLSEPDSIPRIMWGKVKRSGNTVTVPFSVTGHHGLIDGFHIGKLFETIQMT